MYIAIRRYTVEPQHVPTILHLVETEFIHIISQVPGYVGYYGIDSGDGVIASVTIYEDEAGAEEANRLAAGWVQENLAHLLPNPAQATVGTVIMEHHKEQ